MLPNITITTVIQVTALLGMIEASMVWNVRVTWWDGNLFATPLFVRVDGGLQVMAYFASYLEDDLHKYKW